MILELYGLPGAGKTTFAKKLVENSDFKIVTIRNRASLLFYNILFLLRFPVKSLGLFYFLCIYGRKLFRYKFINIYLHNNAKYIKAKFYKRAIIDQGHFQNIVSLFEEEISLKVLTSYVKFFCKPDALVVFDYEKIVREDRLKMRGYGAREQFAGYDAEKWRMHSEHNFVLSISALPFLRIPFWRIINDGDAERLENHLRQKMLPVIHYIFRGRMPTEKAHGLQIAKMCEAFTTLGYAVCLHITYRKNNISENLFSFYGVTPFALKQYGVFNFATYFVGTRAGLAVEKFLWFIYWLIKPKKKNILYYTRNEEIAWSVGVWGLPVIFEAHNVTERLWKQRILSTFLRKAKLVVCNSIGTEDAIKVLGIRGNTFVAPNGVSADTFVVTEPQSLCRQSIHFPIDKKIVMYVGKFYAWKGVDFLLDTWHAFFGGKNDMLLVLVGGEKKDINRLRAIYKSANIMFVPPQKHANVPLYLRSADVLVLPNISNTKESRDFTSPIKIYEYMASGTPVVAADLQSIKNLATNEEVIFFRHDDQEGLRDAILEATIESDMLHNMVSNARIRALSNTWYNRAHNIIKEIV